MSAAVDAVMGVVLPGCGGGALGGGDDGDGDGEVSRSRSTLGARGRSWQPEVDATGRQRKCSLQIAPT